MISENSNNNESNSSILSETSKSQAHEVTEQICLNYMFNTLSLANKIGSKELEEPHDILKIPLFIIMALSFIWFRRFQEKTNIRIDEELLTPADYTVKISNIPTTAHFNYEDKLLSLFNDNEQILGKKYEVKKINLVYQNDKIEEIEEKLKDLMKKKKKILKENGFNLEDAEIHKINKFFEKKELDLRKMKFKMIERREGFAGKAFVSFNKEDGNFFFSQSFKNIFSRKN